MFQYAVKDYFKRKEEEEKKKKEREKELEEAENPKKTSWVRNVFGLEFGLQIVIIMLLFALFWYWNKSSFFATQSKNV